MHYVTEDRFKLCTGEEHLSLYQFHTNTAKHYFCKTCGIYPFHRPRTKPGFYGINVGCLEDVDVSHLEPELLDGKALD